METNKPLLFLLFLAVSAVLADEDVFIGVNIGTELSDMPHPTQVNTTTSVYSSSSTSYVENNKCGICKKAVMLESVSANDGIRANGDGGGGDRVDATGGASHRADSTTLGA
ncbi:hypothetical protein MTR67_046608 [Solanum verrucosum]|uniref:Uncharacterized protein n=1 Tax=Solanum verrucosum TaxID=315347 RepID=A0AAF0ZXD8_SOLVR|nr:hypothetical protein MTR67_046608 [Solanum verrucosum]